MLVSAASIPARRRATKPALRYGGPMSWILLLTACASCFDPPGEDAKPNDTDDFVPPIDTAEDTGEDTGDVPLPGKCSLPHEDDENFSNDYSQPTLLPLDTWACGSIDAVNDVEYFNFTTAQGGWVKVEAQAEARGSSADLFTLVSFLTGDDAVTTTGRPNSADPLTLFYAPDPGDYLASLAETSGGYGEAYTWWFVVSMTKSPVDFDLTEQEPNNDRAHATTLVPVVQVDDDGNVVEPGVSTISYYGSIGDGGDADWWIIDIPEGADLFLLDIDSFKYGAPTDIQLTLYWTDSSGALDFFDDEGTDEDGSAEDPWGEYDIARIRKQGAADYPERTSFDQIAVRTANWNGSVGSMFHWYTLRLTMTDLEKSE
jgi:hypothetical protein